MVYWVRVKGFIKVERAKDSQAAQKVAQEILDNLGNGLLTEEGYGHLDGKNLQLTTVILGGKDAPV